MELRQLLNTYRGKKIYIYLESKEAGTLFLKQAEKENFTFGDGQKPTKRKADRIFALNEDFTINYVGFAGHMAFGAASEISGKELVRINYPTMEEIDEKQKS